VWAFLFIHHPMKAFLTVGRLGGVRRLKGTFYLNDNLLPLLCFLSRVSDRKSAFIINKNDSLENLIIGTSVEITNLTQLTNN
jgi:hypothetical protein